MSGVDLLAERIAGIAELAYRDRAQFERHAEAIAESLDAGGLRALWQGYDRFDTPLDVPAGFRSEEGNTVSRWAAWTSFWRIALAEILYRARERSLPVLREYAFSGESLVHLGAFSLLAHLAAEGVGTEAFLGLLSQRFSEMPETAQEGAVEILTTCLGPRRAPDATHWTLPGGRALSREEVTPDFLAGCERLLARPDFQRAREALLEPGDEEDASG